MPIIKLQSSDGVVFDVDVDTIKCSATIKTMLDDLDLDDNGEDEIVPLPNVNSVSLKKVIQWAIHYKDIPKSEDISEWEEEFLKMDLDSLYDLTLSANYLDIQGLLDLTCLGIANMIKGKSSEEIRKTFNLKKDPSSD